MREPLFTEFGYDCGFGAYSVRIWANAEIDLHAVLTKAHEAGDSAVLTLPDTARIIGQQDDRIAAVEARYLGQWVVAYFEW